MNLTNNEKTGILDWVSACQSAYHIDSTPDHRFGGLGSNLEENRAALIEYIESIIVRRVSTPSAPAVDGGAFEWPLLPEFPNAMWTCNGACLFTEHQMHGYANAYGEIVRAALSARSDAAAGEPFAYYRDCVYGSGTTMREYNRINEFADGGEGSPLYSGPQAASGQKLTDAARDVIGERKRQVTTEGCLPEVDDTYEDGQMALVAGNYALACAYPHERDLGRGQIPPYWPWAPSWWKPTTKRRNLVKAGALILAEIERLDRASSATASDSADAEGT